MPELQQTVKALFGQALEIRSESERALYLDQACAGNAILRAEVVDLLDAFGRAGNFLGDTWPPEAPTELPLSEKPCGQIGPYKLLEQIGSGGMGSVYMAEQREPVRRKVAIKLIKPGMDTRQVVARFEAERQALAMMNHPSIAKVLDAGATDGGRPYFVMELVKGQPITEYCDQRRLTPRRRLELFVPVCQAIQHAHQKGIIHRDIKPSNVLVAEYDGHPVAKVIDFGVAKAVSQSLTEKTMYTGFGQIVGTLAYMSPEQARVNQMDIDTRSDVYSLGVLLYELLVGSTPFDKQRLRTVAWDEMLRILREEEPPKPSTRLSTATDSLPTISAQRQTEPAKLTKLVRGELEWIVMKALEKDRARRYETAIALAADLERYLQDEPVAACPPSVAYRASKAVRRHKTALATATAVIFALLIGTGVSVWQAAAAKKAQTEAEQQRRDAEQNLDLAREAVDKLLEKLNEEVLPPSPHFDGLRRAVANEVEEFHRRLLAQKGDSLAVRFSVARAWRRIGEVKYESQDFDAAIAAFDRSFAKLEELIASHPADLRFLKELADGNQWLANWEIHYRWDSTRAKKHLTRARDLYHTLAKLEPNQPDHTFQVMAQQAEVDRIEGRSNDEAWHRQRVAAARAYAAQHPTNLRYRAYVVTTHTQMAAFLEQRGDRTEEIVTLLEDNIKLLQDCVREGGNERHYGVNLAYMLEWNASFLHRHGDRIEAEKLFRQALNHYDNLFRRLRLGHHDEATRALCRIKFGEMLEQQERVMEAEQLYRVALDDLAHDGWGQRWNALMHLTDLMMKQKRPESAAARLAQFIAVVREETRDGQTRLPRQQELLIAELMRAEAAGEEIVSVKAALGKLALPAWSDAPGAATGLVQLVRPLASPSSLLFPRTAVAIAEQAVTLAPDQFDTHRVLGIARYRAQDIAGAVASLKRSLEIKPEENIATSLFLAMALWRQGELIEARQWYEKAAAWIASQQSVPEQLRQLDKEARSQIHH